MVVISYRCSNFFYGRKAASDDITNKKDAVVLKTCYTLEVKRWFSVLRRIFSFPFSLNLLKASGEVSSPILRMGALSSDFYFFFRLTVTSRSELGPSELLALPNCSGAPPAFPVLIKMSWWASLRQGGSARVLVCETEGQGQARGSWLGGKSHYFSHMLSKLVKMWTQTGWLFLSGTRQRPSTMQMSFCEGVLGFWEMKVKVCRMCTAPRQSPVAVGLGSLCNPTANDSFFDVPLMNSGIPWLPY